MDDKEIDFEGTAKTLAFRLGQEREHSRELTAEIERLRTVAKNTVSLLEHLTNSHQSATKHAMCWRVLEQARGVLSATP